MTPSRDGWVHLRATNEHRYVCEIGLELVLYLDSGLWRMRLAGWQHKHEQVLNTSDLVEAKKRALRRAALLLEQAVEQISAALVNAGTGMN